MGGLRCYVVINLGYHGVISITATFFTADPLWQRDNGNCLRQVLYFFWAEFCLWLCTSALVFSVILAEQTSAQMELYLELHGVAKPKVSIKSTEGNAMPVWWYIITQAWNLSCDHQPLRQNSQSPKKGLMEEVTPGAIKYPSKYPH